MAKTLIIKSANFSANKLETVTITDVVVCTSLSLNKSTLSVGVGYNETLVATVLPSDLSSSITWYTSDPSIATVNNGVVTAVGVGSATITATCGDKTATCSITTSFIPVVLDTSDRINGYMASVSSASDYAKSAASVNYAVMGYKTNVLGGYKALMDNANIGLLYPYGIPNNATSMKIEVNNIYTSIIYLFDSFTQTSANGMDSAKYIGTLNDGQYATEHNYDLSNYHGANGFLLVLRMKNKTPDNITGNVTITFS